MCRKYQRRERQGVRVWGTGKWVTRVQHKMVPRDKDGDVMGVTHWGWRTGS